MRAVSSANLLAAQNALGYGAQAVVDGMEIVEHPFITISNNRVNPVPLLSGNVLNEGTGFVRTTRPVSEQVYEKTLQASFASLTPLVLQEYACSNYNASDCFYALAEVFGDNNLVCPTLQMANSFTKASISNYGYVFTHPPYWNPSLGAFHSSEIAFVFSTLQNIYRNTPAEVTLSHQMTQYWTDFASSGNPNSPTAPPLNWPPYDSTTYTRMMLDTTLKTQPGWKVNECAFWETIYKIIYTT